ncbi:hypothetical protein [Persicobacter diffluens]|uniref:Uncharacterized protein n=1 Tax=Persicobacter diffluens TaxID=981 RepID=A0AAN5ANR2_9BACT|nr:hypothetical protein PEDI_36550 [Persicobacter diffluens]
MGNFGNREEQELGGQFQIIDQALSRAWELFQVQLKRAFEEEAKAHCIAIRKSIQNQFLKGHLSAELFHVIVDRFLEQVNPVLRETPSEELEEALIISLRVLSQAKVKSIVYSSKTEEMLKEKAEILVFTVFELYLCALIGNVQVKPEEEPFIIDEVIKKFIDHFQSYNGCNCEL